MADGSTTILKDRLPVKIAGAVSDKQRSRPMVPIYLPPVVVPHEVLDEEKRIIAEEGWFHVAGRYIASAPDADKARRVEAEKRVAENERQSLICAFCSKPITGNVAVVIALRSVHPRCAQEFEEWIYGEKPKVTPPEPPVSLEQQLRKSIELGRIQDNDLVQWGEWVDEDTPNERYEYEPVRWADLSVYERHSVERQPDGRLVGGYPF